MDSPTIKCFLYYISFSIIWIEAIPLQNLATETNLTQESVENVSNGASVYSNGKPSFENGNYTAEHHTASSTNGLSITSSIYINRSEKEIPNKETILKKSPAPDTYVSEEKKEITTKEMLAYRTDNEKDKNRSLIGSSRANQTTMNKRDKINSTTANLNVINFLNESNSDNNNTSVTEAPVQNSIKTNVEIPQTTTQENPTTSSNNVKNNDSYTSTDKSITTVKSSHQVTTPNSNLNTSKPISYQNVHHITGFIQNVPLHRKRQKIHRPLHHLNLVPIEDGPFGSLIWKDKKYLISVLVPIAIGVIGAGCIIGMAYVVRFCHKNEKRIQQMKESLQQSQVTKNDQIILLQDSDEEI